MVGPCSPPSLVAVVFLGPLTILDGPQESTTVVSVVFLGHLVQNFDLTALCQIGCQVKPFADRTSRRSTKL